MIGRAIANRTLGGTGVGPGAISWYFFMCFSSLVVCTRCPTVAEAARPRQRRGRISAMALRTVRTMCPMNCHPTLCGMLVDVEDGRIADVRGDPDNPDSRGFLCIRGQAAREIVGNPLRLLHPMRRAGRSGTWQRTTWDDALDTIAERPRAVGPAALGPW